MYVLLEETRRAVHDLSQNMGRDFHMDVLSADELMQQAMAYPGFDVFYQAAKQASFVALQEGKSTYVEETIRLLEQILDFTGITTPMAVVAFAPPYYPAADSMAAQNSEFTGLLEKLSAMESIRFNRYFNGVSDCSYCCVDPNFNEKMIEKNLLLWGKAYPFDLNSLKKLQIPFMLLGPWGKDLHERTERVNIESVSKKLPAVLDAILSYVGEIDS